MLKIKVRVKIFKTREVKEGIKLTLELLWAVLEGALVVDIEHLANMYLFHDKIINQEDSLKVLKFSCT